MDITAAVVPSRLELAMELGATHTRATSDEMKPEASERAPRARRTERSTRESSTKGSSTKGSSTKGSSTKGSKAKPPAPPPSPTFRRPQQERGQRRVDAILDAAAVLVAADGIAAVTMHRVAQHSGTTIGSMYHFFLDREAVLHALTLRHTQALRALTAETGRDTAEHWSQRSTAEAVDRFLGPFLTYVDRHPDLLPLGRFARSCGWNADREAEMDRLVTQLAEAVIASRNPAATPAELRVRALTMTAMVEGVMGAASRQATASSGTPSVAAVRLELRRALVAYLDSPRPPAVEPVRGTSRLSH